MKNIKYLIIFLISFFICINKVYALDEIVLNSPNYIVFDLDKQNNILESNIDKQINIASLTKIMTTLTAIEQASDLKKEVTITNEMLSLVSYDASIAGLKEGDIVTIEDLLYATMLPSGADASIALAYGVSGDVKSFVTLMNDTAKKIDMSNTNFMNTHGLDAINHYSTLNDLKKLLSYALKNELFKTVYETKKYTLTNGLEVKATVNYYNSRTDYDLKRIRGSKTGFTSKAGLCISFLFESNDHNYIAITSGAIKDEETPFPHITDAFTIINWTDENYQNILLSPANTLYSKIVVLLSKQEKYNIVSYEDVYLYLPKDYDKNKFKVKYVGIETIDYKYQFNSRLGKLKYYYDNVEFYEEDVLLNTHLKISILKIIIKYRIIIIMVIIVIMLNIFMVIKSKKNKRVLA